MAAAGGWQRKVPIFVRIASHVVVWTTVLASMAIVLSKGWAAGGDDAAIAIHSYQTFSFHPPLVGVFSVAASPGHVLFDPGPLLFWLMAIPVHLDPRHGLVWGAALAWGAALSLAVEAVWWSRAWLGCAVVAFTAVDLVSCYPNLFERPMWNAYFPIPFLIATIALSWVVATGSYGWWPVLVLVASVAAQSHLLFTLPALSLAVVAPVAGYALGARPARLRWLATGAVVAAACWMAPAIQGLGPGGNLVALAKGSGGQPVFGVDFGLRTIATATSLSPIWLHSVPARFGTVVLITDNASFPGAVALGVLAAIAALGWWRGRTPLTALALVALTCSLGVMVSFASFPQKNLFNLGYLTAILWVVGILCWTVGVWAVVVVVAALFGRHRNVDFTSTTRGALTLVGLAAVAVVVVVGAMGLMSLATFVPDSTTVGANETDVALVGTIAQAIEHRTSRVAVDFGVDLPPGNDSVDLWLSEGVAFRLESDGRSPGLYGIARSTTGLVPLPRSALFIVGVEGRRVTSIKSAQCAPLPIGCRAPLSARSTP